MPTIWHTDDERDHSHAPSPPPPISPYEARSMADLIMPLQRERVRELCEALGTTPQDETTAMCGAGVDFYRLSGRSARALIIALENRVRGVVAA